MRKTDMEMGFNIIRSLLVREVGLPDGTIVPGMTIDRKCTILIEGFMGGYHYPEVPDGKAQKVKPDGGGYYEHLMDALRYIIICMYKSDGTVFKNTLPFFPKRGEFNKLTGY
jgi:hypothetical protein